MVVLLPVGVIGNATSRVFFQRACEEKNRSGSIENIVREVQQRLISIAMFPMLILLIIGPELFSVVLGQQWSVAGVYAGILAPWILFVFIASPLGSIFYVLEKQAIDLTFNLLILVSRFVVLIIGGLSGDPIVALILYSSTGVLFWGGMNLYLLKISGISYLFGVKEYFRFFGISLVVAIPMIAAKLFAVSTIILLIVAGVASIVYYAIIIHYDPVLKKAVYGALRR
jgi:O-antigen/teichoic acid export membrane protein